MGIALVNKSKFSADQKKEVFDTSFVNFGDCFQQYTAFSVRLVKRNRKNVQLDFLNTIFMLATIRTC